MKEYFKKLMEKYFYKKNFPFKFEKVSAQVYAAAEEFTFTDKPLKDEVFVQKFIIDNEKISSVCALYHINITNYEEKFNELAELFMNQYDLSIRYDLEYEAIKVSMAIDNETIEDEEIEEENLMEYLTTFPALICRMFTYALLICVDDDIPPSEVFDDVMKDEDLFIIPEDISFYFGNATDKEEGQKSINVNLPENFKLEELTPEHMKQICEIEKKSFPDPWDYDEIWSDIDNEDSISFVITKDDKVCGFIVGGSDGDSAWVNNIAVSPDYRRQGIGTSLLDALSQAAYPYQGLALIVRDSNTSARKFYDEYGFFDLEVKEGYYNNPKENGIVMMYIPIDV